MDVAQHSIVQEKMRWFIETVNNTRVSPNDRSSQVARLQVNHLAPPSPWHVEIVKIEALSALVKQNTQNPMLLFTGEGSNRRSQLVLPEERASNSLDALFRDIQVYHENGLNERLDLYRVEWDDYAGYQLIRFLPILARLYINRSSHPIATLASTAYSCEHALDEIIAKSEADLTIAFQIDDGHPLRHHLARHSLLVTIQAAITVWSHRDGLVEAVVRWSEGQGQYVCEVEHMDYDDQVPNHDMDQFILRWIQGIGGNADGGIGSFYGLGTDHNNWEYSGHAYPPRPRTPAREYDERELQRDSGYGDREDGTTTWI